MHRTITMIVTLIGFALIVLIFTRPLLAPDSGSDAVLKHDDAGSDESVFNTIEGSGPIGEGVQADSFLIFDESTGTVIASRKPDTPVAIASLTKLMTAYTVQKHGNLDDSWAITSENIIDIRPLLGLRVGDKVLVRDLVSGMLVGSANDAAAALGSYITQTTGIPAHEVMNAEAKLLGMHSTHFENPIGFDSEQNYSNANDLMLLVQKIRNIELFTSIDRNQSYSFTSAAGQKYFIKATNTLLQAEPDLHAIKTGFTDEAGGAMITAVRKEGRGFVMIVLSSPDREADTLRLKEQVLGTITGKR